MQLLAALVRQSYRSATLAATLLTTAGSAMTVGCVTRGAVTFTIQVPSLDVFNPVTDRVSDYTIRAPDGTVIGVASHNANSPRQLALGPLPTFTIPEDLSLSVLSGSELLGMARVANVAIRTGTQSSYVANVRKPLIFVGSAAPDENPSATPAGGEILDPTTSSDLAHPASTATAPPTLPAGTSAGAVTSDGLFYLAGRSSALSVVSTDTGRTIGDLPLPFTPTRIVAAPHSVAAAALDPSAPDGSIVLYTDLSGLGDAPPHATSNRIFIRGDAPRSAAFSADGKRLYVLTGGASGLDPCGSAGAPKSNQILAIGLDGQIQATWSLSSFAFDLAVDTDPSRGLVVVSLPNANTVVTIDPATPTGPVAGTKLFAATCPSALHVTGGQVFVITSGRDSTQPNGNNFVLQRGQLGSQGGDFIALPFPGPFYEEMINLPGTSDGNTTANLKLRPGTLIAYDMAVTPDASVAVFATRAHYREVNQQFFLVGLVCTANVDIVEYGRYSLDTRTGNAAYKSRSKLVVSPAAGTACVTCMNNFIAVPFLCRSEPGDRASGVAAVFGAP